MAHLILPREVDSKFRFITVAAQRAKQLQNGAKPRVETRSRKATRVAIEEAMAGAISWEVREDLKIAREEMDRVQAIINNLLEFSRASTVEVEPVDVNDLLRKTLLLMNKYLQSSEVHVQADASKFPGGVVPTRLPPKRMQGRVRSRR